MLIDQFLHASAYMNNMNKNENISLSKLFKKPCFKLFDCEYKLFYGI